MEFSNKEHEEVGKEKRNDMLSRIMILAGGITIVVNLLEILDSSSGGSVLQVFLGGVAIGVGRIISKSR